MENDISDMTMLFCHSMGRGYLAGAQPCPPQRAEDGSGALGRAVGRLRRGLPVRLRPAGADGFVQRRGRASEIGR